jgi:hypothetical protein
MVNVVIFMTIWNILRTFGIMYGRLVYLVCGHLVHFSRFGTFGARKIWQPCPRVVFSPSRNMEMEPQCAKCQELKRCMYEHMYISPSDPYVHMYVCNTGLQIIEVPNLSNRRHGQEVMELSSR